MSDNVVNITGGKGGDGPANPRDMDRLDRQDLIHRRLAQIGATLHVVRFALKEEDSRPAAPVITDCLWGLNDMVDEVEAAFDALTEKPEA